MPVVAAIVIDGTAFIQQDNSQDILEGMHVSTRVCEVADGIVVRGSGADPV